MFLIRTAFWLSLLILLLPTGEQSNTTDHTASLGVGEVYGAAEATYSDMTKFCERNPGVCEKSRSAWDTFEKKAKYGAQMVYRYLREQTPETEEPRSDQQRSTQPVEPDPHAAGNLTDDDLIPAWVDPRT